MVHLLLPHDGGAGVRPARGFGRLWASMAAVEWRGGPGVPRAHARLPSLARRGLWWHDHSSRGGDGATAVEVTGKGAQEGRRTMEKVVAHTVGRGGA